MAISYGSLFSGIGGFDLGFDKAGMRCAWQVEKDQKARDVLKNHWPDILKYEDVKNVGTRNLEPVDLICGGFPCQDVSVAGRRAGLAGERSGLWFEFVRIIDELKPEWVVIENVAGLLSSNGGRDMGTIVGGLEKLGYWWAYRVLDAQYFGVPQRRRRVFIVGCLTRGCPQEVLFERESSPWDTPPSRETGSKIADTITSCPYADNEAQHRNLIAFAPEAGGNTGLNINSDLSGTLQENQVMAVAFGGNNTSGPVSVATSCNAHSGRYDFESETFVCGFDSGQAQYTGDISAPLRVNGAVSPGVNPGKPDNSCVAGDKVGPRRLTPIECERLQGFPDDWTAMQWQSDSCRYRQLGNAVAVSVAEWLGKQIIKLI